MLALKWKYDPETAMRLFPGQHSQLVRSYLENFQRKQRPGQQRGAAVAWHASQDVANLLLYKRIELVGLVFVCAESFLDKISQVESVGLEKS